LHPQNRSAQDVVTSPHVRRAGAAGSVSGAAPRSLTET
jgi:hypothetical protein